MDSNVTKKILTKEKSIVEKKFANTQSNININQNTNNKFNINKSKDKYLTKYKEKNINPN